jgi:SAM-dependent methyltransferase
MASERSYILSAAEADLEAARLGLLEEIADPGTIRRLSQLVVKPGLRCLEVGAGRGTIARWLSARVGVDGHVVAADIDCRFLTNLPDNVEVRKIDIRTDSFEPEAYDVVHCRTLLMHLPDPAAALRTMTAALRPGGVLLAEEGDGGLLAYNGHPDAEWATSLVHSAFAALASSKAMNAYFGRTLPGLFIEAGLRVTGGEVDNWVARFGDPAAAFQRSSAEDMSAAFVAAGVMTEEERERARAVWCAPSTVVTTVGLVSVWGQRVD